MRELVVIVSVAVMAIFSSLIPEAAQTPCDSSASGVEV